MNSDGVQIPAKHESRAGNVSMSLESHLPDATFGESMAGNGFDYFEIWPLEFDFGTLKMTTFDENPAIFGHFCPKPGFRE